MDGTYLDIRDVLKTGMWKETAMPQDRQVKHVHDLSRDISKLDGAWRIEQATTLEGIHQRKQQWLDLEEACNDPHCAFQGYVWCEAWAAQYCTNSSGDPRPQIFFVYKNGNGKSEQLVAILPMMLVNRLGMRMLTLFGEPHSQQTNAITKADVDCTEGLRLCIEQAAALTNADTLTLGGLPANSQLANALPQDCLTADPAEYMSVVGFGGVENSEEYLKSLGKNRRADFFRKRNRFERLGETSFVAYTPSSPEFRSKVQKALTLKRDWLKRSGMFSIGLSHEGTDEFFNRFSSHEGAHDGGHENRYGVELEELSVDGKTVALSLNVIGKGMRHCYLTTYDEAYSDVSPGTLIHQKSIQRSVDEGYVAYNFLGFPTHFKAMWLTEKEPLVCYRKALTLRGRLWIDVWIGSLKPAAKTMLVKARALSDLPIIGPVFRKSMNMLSKMRGQG